MTSTPLCAHPPCRRLTLDPSGRCHLHRGVTKNGRPRSAPIPKLAPAAEPEWSPGSGLPHPTGNYDTVEIETDLGQVTTRYLLDGKAHREDGPAYVKGDIEGLIRFETWARNGKVHRDDGPAYVRYFFTGKLSGESWYSEGELHREDGPAKVDYDPHDGSVKLADHLLFGREVTAEEHAEAVSALAEGAPREWVFAYLEGRDS